MAPTATNSNLSPSKSTSGALSSAQLDKFRSDGYLILPDFFHPTTILNHSRSLIQNFDPSQHPLTKFTTGEDTKQDDAHVGDRYFLESGDKIRYFLEQDSIDPKTGKLNRSPELAVNKCGHALHSLDSTFHQLSFSSKVQNLIASLENYRTPKVLQSMIICKQPAIGGAVPSHNDSTFLFTSPPSATGLWFALEDCTKSNGCLSFLPGSHRWPQKSNVPAEATSSGKHIRPQNESEKVVDKYGVPRGVNKRFVRTEPGSVDSGTSFEVLSENEEEQWDESSAIVEECKAGTLVLIHGSVMHKSEKNLSQKSRYIYTFHCIEGEAEYDEKNWLQPTPEMPFSNLYDPPQRPIS